MILEIIAQCEQDIIDINKSMATRIELCGGMEHGGLTPDFSLVEFAAENSEIPVRVMVRNIYDSYSYDQKEIDLICSQIGKMKNLDIEGFVFGCNAGNNINTEQLMQICNAAYPKKITYHRAFDLIMDKEKGIKELLTHNVDSVLTNLNIDNYSALELENFKYLNKYGVKIIIGGGVNKSNIKFISNFTNCIHVGSAVRLDENFENKLDVEAINELWDIISK